MKSDSSLSSMNRRVLLSGSAMLPALSGLRLCAIAQAQTTQDGPLGSWNDGPAKKAILGFVRATTDQASSKFVPPEERIATFDQRRHAMGRAPNLFTSCLLPRPRTRCGREGPKT